MVCCADITSLQSSEQVFDRLTAFGSNFSGRVAVLQCVKSGTHHVVRVRRAMALGHDIGDTDHFENSTHRTAGNDASTFGCWVQFNAGSAMVTGHTVVDRAVFQRHFHQVATRLFHTFLYGDGHFLGFAFAHTHATITVAHHGQRSEAEDTTALDNLGDAVDRNHFFAQTVVTTFVLHFGGKFCHFYPLRLELQARFASGFSQSLDTAVVCKTSTVKSHFFDTSSLGFLGNTLANQRGSCHVATLACGTQLGTHFCLGGGCRSKHLGAVFGKHAGIDMQVGAIDAQTRHALLGNTDAGLTCTAQTLFFFAQHHAAPYFFLVSLIVTFSSA